MFDLLLPKKTFTVEMIMSKKVGNHFLLGNGSQPPKIEVEDRIQKTGCQEKKKKRPGAVRCLLLFEELVVDLVEEFARLEKALKWKIYYCTGDVGPLGRLFLNNTIQAWDPPTFRRFFDLMFSTKQIF